jgi:hypothetical protein
MTSKEFLNFIERCIGKDNIGYVSSDNFKKLKPFFESELHLLLDSNYRSDLTYFDLYTDVEKKIKESKMPLLASYQNKPKYDSKNTLMILKHNESFLIPISNDISKGLKYINDKIAFENQALRNCLEDITKTPPTIDIKRNFIGQLTKDSVEKSLCEGYSSLCGFVLKCGNAVQSSNGNINNVLVLLKLLTAAEVDLYRLMDNQSIQNNELRELIIEWCRIHGIHDKDVDKLIESSFQRAYTLRDRINNLRNDFNEKLEKETQETEKFKKEQKDILEAMHKEQEESLNRIEKHLNDSLAELKQSSDALAKSQEDFVFQSKEQTSLALSEFQKEAKHKVVEIKEQTDGFIENQNALFAKMKKQLTIYKVVSIIALAISIVSLLYNILF